MDITRIWGHRGALHFAPENTLTSCQLAVDMGADGVEFDIQLTKDSEVVVCHDETIDRTSTGTGFIRDYTLAELKRINFNKRGITEPKFMEIPTLRETLELLEPTALDINIELKTGVVFYENMERKAYEIVGEYGLSERVVWSSFNHCSVLKIKKIDKTARAGLLCGGGILISPAQCAAVGAEALHAGIHQLAYPGLVANCEKHGVKLRAYTVDDSADLMRAFEMGLDAVFTNRIDTAKAERKVGQACDGLSVLGAT
jgi:glycerophosphoryl diester phosphodiesterase